MFHSNNLKKNTPLIISLVLKMKMSQCMRFPTMSYVRPANPQISLRICLCYLLEYSMIVKLLTGHDLEFLSLKGGCTGPSESTRQNATLFEILCHGSKISWWFCNHMTQTGGQHLKSVSTHTI